MITGGDIQTRQGEFRQELGLRNLVMCQILNIVGLFWVGAAAKLGPSHVAFWLLGIVLFYLPSAAVVIYLNRAHTLEGGLYEWTRLGFNEFAGFLVGWNLWLNGVMILSYVGIQSVAMFADLVGPRAGWMTQSKWVMGGATLVVLLALMGVAFVGMSLGKWIQDLGGILTLAVFAALIALPFRNRWIGRHTQFPPLALSLPAISVLSLNLLGKMSFGAMSGFDSMAIFAGECRDAAKSIGRSVMIATPIIAAMFVLGTSSVVAIVPQDKIDLVSPITQTLVMGTGREDPGARLIPLSVGALLVSYLAGMALIFATVTRLPLVAGWDHLLPAWFGRLHPRRKTPTNSIMFVGAVAFVVAMAGVLGSGQQEAFQLLQNAGGILYAITYLAMFALPLAGHQREIAKPPLWLQAASASGFLMTAMYLVLSLFPIIDLPHPLVFTAEVGGFVLVCQLMAAGLFWSYRRQTHSLV
jgi:glutamate:GABA antiporter